MIFTLVLFLLMASSFNALYTLNGQDWTGLCQKGTKQSPIDIQSAKEQNPQCEYIRFSFNKSVMGHTIVEDAIKIQGQFFEFQIQSDDLIVKYYKIVQFHLHTLSEHTIDGQQYPLELHLVSQQQNAEDRLMVFGIIFQVTDDENEESQFFKEFQIPDKDQAKEFEKHLNLYNNFKRIFSQGQRIYAYEGSLTTPTCTENVFWNVLEEPLKISQKTLDKIKEILSGESMPRGNWRETQPLNQRQVSYRKLCTFSNLIKSSYSN